MAQSLASPSIDAALRAAPSVTTTTGGVQIPYPFPSPADWRDQWIYFLLVDRFDNPADRPRPDVYPCDTYQGGTFEGVRRRLPYLRDLGVGAIWLSPERTSPYLFYQFWMQVEDADVDNCLRIFTELTQAEIEELAQA